jgi:lipopolysaccharide transport system ATP-binding protein
MQPIIEVHNLSKKYKIGAVQPRYLSLRDSLSTTFKGVKNWVNFEKSERLKPINNTDFWALKDINFEIQAGESIGIIGRNGAGKSTLLKILSRITPPTSGRAILRGRLASLLEVGTGFHPELTGRENVYFNGSILGLRKSEIDRKFDEIVDFSGVERFIDTPLKQYSSGMQLRLAFAVAAHLEPEILIIDEVLAVGDAEFQKKCLGKMEGVSQSGRTIIFVSHNLAAVRQLCKRGIIMDKGQITFDSTIDKAIDFYENNNKSSGEAVWVNDVDKNPKMLLERIEITDAKGDLRVSFMNDEDIFIHFFTRTYENLQNVKVGFDLMREGVILFRTYQIDTFLTDKFQNGEAYQFICKIPRHLLSNGEHFIRPLFSVHCVLTLTRCEENVLSFSVETKADNQAYFLRYTKSDMPGVILPILDWTETPIKQ